MKIEQSRKVQFVGSINASRLGAFIDSIPDYAEGKAVIRVTQDCGGGTPLDPGRLVTITATWTDEEDE